MIGRFCQNAVNKHSSWRGGECVKIYSTARACKNLLLLASFVQVLARDSRPASRANTNDFASLKINGRGAQKSVVTRVLSLLATQSSFMGTSLSDGWLIPSEKVDVRVFASMDDKNTKKAFTKSIGHVVQALQDSNVMSLHIIPWGLGTVLSGEGATLNLTDMQNQDPSTLIFECGNRPAESCKGNLWQGCLQKSYPNMKQYFPVSLCIIAKACLDEERPPDECFGPTDVVAESCVEDFGDGMNITELKQCVNGTEGKSILLENAMATMELDPSPKSMPWVTINGEPLVEMGDKGSEELLHLGRDVCETYSQDSWKMVDACKGFWESSKIGTANSQDGSSTPSVFEGRSRTQENGGTWILTA